MKVTGGEAVVRSLVEHDVKVVYGLPGSHILSIYNALRDEGRIKNILVMHEGNAAFMADAHGRLTGKPGVCIVTGGPGATNAVTGIAQAYTEASPVIQISGCSSSLRKIQPDHGVDDLDYLLKIYGPLTKWSTRIRSVDRIPKTVSKAFVMTVSDRPGPVHLEIPSDVLSSSGEVDKVTGTSPKADSLPGSSAIHNVVEILESAANPIIAVGRGVLREFCSAKVAELAEKLRAPIVTLPSAISAIPYQHPLYLGYDLPVCSHKSARWLVHPAINSFIRKADVILTVGFDVGERLLCFRDTNGKRVHIHHDRSAVDHDNDNLASKPTVSVATNVKEFVSLLEKEVKRDPASRSQAIVERRISSAKQKVREDISKSIRWGNKPLHPGEISTKLRRVLDDDAIVTLDVGNAASWMKICYRSEKSNTILTPGRYSSMGFSLPAAIAAKINFPERQVVAVAGDGDFLMSYMDFPTIVKYKLGIVIVVQTNRQYGMIWHTQRTEYKGRTFATEIVVPDLVGFAQAFGVAGIKVTDPKDLDNALEEAIDVKGPVLVDVETAHEFPAYLPTKIRRLGRKVKGCLKL